MNEVVRPELEGGIELMRHALLDLGYRPRQIQGYANDLRESGYEALADGSRAQRRMAFDRMLASMRDVDLHWVRVGDGSAVAGKSLAELDLRAAVGVNAVALRHGETIEMFLDGATVLHAGDAVGLMGTSEALDRAEEILRGE